MRLIYILAAILAVSVAETSDQKTYDDLLAMETMELKKEARDLTPAASAYNYVPQGQSPPQWNPPQKYPSQTWTPPQADPIQSIPTYVPSAPVHSPYVPPAPVNEPYDHVIASPPYRPPVQSDYVPPQNSYHPQNTWSTPRYQVPTTTTPTSVIKNEQQFWDNGAYRYEYQLADGTHVGEEGYHTDAKGSEESLVKRGWYSYVGADGKTYTVKYWADHTGYHAYGDHLPTPPPIPAEIQAALDKEEAEKNKRPVTFPPPQTQKPYYPPQQTYYPPQQTYYPQQSGYGK